VNGFLHRMGTVPRAHATRRVTSYIGVRNLYDRENVAWYYWNEAKQQARYQTWAGTALRTGSQTVDL
jgi:hypothetical protein